jgi:hypothetical protein
VPGGISFRIWPFEKGRSLFLPAAGGQKKTGSFLTVLQFEKAVIPGEANYVGRDPWFDGLTTLSEAEGESRKIKKNQIILDPPPLSAGDDEL